MLKYDSSVNVNNRLNKITLFRLTIPNNAYQSTAINADLSLFYLFKKKIINPKKFIYYE